MPICDKKDGVGHAADRREFSNARVFFISNVDSNLVVNGWASSVTK